MRGTWSDFSVCHGFYGYFRACCCVIADCVLFREVLDEMTDSSKKSLSWGRRGRRNTAVIKHVPKIADSWSRG